MTPFFAGLARLAAAKPELPWLFFRRELDWRWRSHRQTADHLARGAAAIGAAGAKAATALPLAGVESIAALLATLAAGADFTSLAEAGPGVPFLTVEGAKWPELLPERLERPLLTLPAARGNIERYAAEPLPPGPYGALIEGGHRFELADLEKASGEIAAKLFAGEEPGKKIVHAGARLASATAVALLIATLEKPGSVVALEPYPPATVESLLWCRPTHVLAHSEEIAALCAAWSAKNQRQSRLRRILALGKVDPEWSRTLGVPVDAT